MKKLQGQYNFPEIEKKWQNIWESDNIYRWDRDDARENNFVIDTPPPTVSGHLHMGHIFSYTQTDFIARFQRMNGKNVFYPMGFDDNGLPTERLAEKKKGIKGYNVSREDFVKICQDIIEDEEETFRQLFTSMSLSIDWTLKYQTISSNSAKISQLSFLDLVEKGHVYRSEQPILWDVVDQTALAQADVEEREKESAICDIEFSLAGDENHKNLNNITIATTRPELLPACVAIFFNPTDERYKYLENQYAISPLFSVKVPIIADEMVDIEKGSGLVMCCTFGDNTDIIWWQKYKLPSKIILDKTGRLKENIDFENKQAKEYYSKLAGLKVSKAREQIIQILKENGLLKNYTPITHTVKCAERSKAPLEIITTKQWFVKTIEHKDELKKRSDQINWYPKSMKIKLDNWIDSISWDWCISRQRFFGVPFPVWYSKREKEEGRPIFASIDELPIDPSKSAPKGYTKEEVEPDLDVMDTWATSSVSPQLSSLAINEKYSIDFDKHKKLFPFDLRPQAHEILRTWAFYTILKAHLHEDTLPWKNIMVSGWCLAEDKTKMSKSKGNIIAPLKLIENYGSDVIRYWASNSKLGVDTAFSEDLLKIGKKLVNKIWNSAKFASIHFEKIQDSSVATSSPDNLVSSGLIFCETDLWLLQKLSKTLKRMNSKLEEFEYADAIAFLEEFFWKDLCDNYLEITKKRCYDAENDAQKESMSAILTLYHVLKIVLKLFAPYLPSITEEIYSSIYDSESSIHQKGGWPKLNIDISEKIEQNVDFTVDILNLVRKAKSSKNLSMKAQISSLAINNTENLTKMLENDLLNVTNSDKIESFSSIEKYEITLTDENNNQVGINFV